MVKKYIWENIIIKIGQSASENWSLISDAKQNYIWLHLDNVSSPHVIIEHSDPPKKCINYAARLCVEHSKYNKGTVIVAMVKNITKGEEIGSVYVKKKLYTIKIT
jgi:predicted ribosome quality control (RQC) complex YloA/Tae2 family protein